MWLKLAPYLATLVGVAALFITVNNRAYDRGVAHAEQVCKDVTVPAAEDTLKEKHNTLMSALKGENDAVLRDTKRLRATYERLRKTKPVANCVPLTPCSGGNTGADGAPEGVGGMGVSTEWLDETFFGAATDIARGESCQRQLKNIYVLNGVTP
jgi:hypothetical protein